MESTLVNKAKWANALPQEAAIAIQINGISYAVMMASPNDLEDFAIGFLFTEQLILNQIDIHDIEIQNSDLGINLQVQLANRRLPQVKQKMRHVRGSSGCGICGVTALEHCLPELNKLPFRHVFTEGFPVDLRQKCDVAQQQAKAITKQPSEAVHAAFWLTNNGDITVCREDIGRHNAVDKLIGALLTAKVDTRNGALLVTSRCSVELVQKAIVANIATLISFASPSTLAVHIAEKYNLRLIHVPKTHPPILYDQNALSVPEATI